MNNEILKLFLQALCTYGKYSLCHDPELLNYLEKHEENGKLFYIEITTAACGPKLLWYPLERWHQEKAAQDALMIALDKYWIKVKSIPTMPNDPRDLILKKLEEAKAAGDSELVKKLELVLSML